MPLSRIGAFAEYAAVDCSALAKVPDYLTDEEATGGSNEERKDGAAYIG